MLPSGPASFNRNPRAPPTGPRALLANGTANHHVPLPSVSASSSSAPTPTGPRSLTERPAAATSPTTSRGSTIKINLSSGGKNGWMPGGKHLHPSAASISTETTGTIGRMPTPATTPCPYSEPISTPLPSSASLSLTPPPPPTDPPPPPPPNDPPSLPPPPPPSSLPPPIPTPPSSAPPTPEVSTLQQPSQWPGLPKTGKSSRTIYDPALDKSSSRKGKELVYRYDGESASDDPAEASTPLTDPRLELPSGRAREGRGSRKVRSAFYHLSYTWDANSTSPPPPAPPRAIVVSSLSHLTPSAHIRRHFSQYGVIEEFSQHIDNVTGAPLGICWVKYAGEREPASEVPASGELAAAEVVKSAANGAMKVGVGTEATVVEVVLDRDGSVCKAKVKEAIAKLRPPKDHATGSPKKELSSLPASAPRPPSTHQYPGPRPNGLPAPPHLASSRYTPSPHTNHAHYTTPMHTMSGASPSYAIPYSPAHASSSSSTGMSPSSSNIPTPLNHPLPQRPALPPPLPLPIHNANLHAQPLAPQTQKDYAVRKEKETRGRGQSPSPSRGLSSSSHERTNGGLGVRPPGLPENPLTAAVSMSPVGSAHSHSVSPTHRTVNGRHSTHLEERGDKEVWQTEEHVASELGLNPHDHISIKTSALPRGVVPRESDWRDFFDGFAVEKVLHDSQGWYITFSTPSAATQFLRRDRKLFMNNYYIDFSVHPPHPPARSVEPGSSSPRKSFDTVMLVDSPSAPPPPAMHTLPPTTTESPEPATTTTPAVVPSDQVLVKGAMSIVMAGLKRAFNAELKEVTEEKICEVVDRVQEERRNGMTDGADSEMRNGDISLEVVTPSEPLPSDILPSAPLPPSASGPAIAAKTLPTKKKAPTKPTKPTSGTPTPRPGSTTAKLKASAKDAGVPAPSAGTKALVQDVSLFPIVPPPQAKSKSRPSVTKNMKKRPLAEIVPDDEHMDEMEMLLGGAEGEVPVHSQPQLVAEPPKKRMKKRTAKVVAPATADAADALLASVAIEPAVNGVHTEDEHHDADPDAALFLDELVGGPSPSPVGVPVSTVEDAALELESFGVVEGEPDTRRSSSTSATRGKGPEDELDVEAELLAAVGMGMGMSTGDEELSVTPMEMPPAGSGSKRSRSSTRSEPSREGRARKKTKTPYPVADPSDFGFENEDELVAALAPPTVIVKKKGKGKGKMEDTAYHFTFKNTKGSSVAPGSAVAPGQQGAPSKSARAASTRPSAPSKRAAARPLVVLNGDEAGMVPGPVIAAPLAPRLPSPERPTKIVRPQRPRIPAKLDVDALPDPITEIATRRRMMTAAQVQPPTPTLPPDSPQQPMITDSPQQPQQHRGRRSPSPDPIGLGLAMDDEELFFLKAGLARRRGEDIIPRPKTPTPEEAHQQPQRNTQLRVHRTGSARTEGYYKIPEALKSAYLPQRNRAMVLDDPNASKRAVEDWSGFGTGATTAAASSSSRSNRVNARRLVQGMEQTNKAMGDNTATQLQFNQLRARKKQLIFARSPIHDWGLYAMEAIPQGEMVIEYVGEVIRAQVAEKREKWYERIGIGSSYLFRVDEDLVVDATRKGNLGRLINHCCTPNCNAKIIVVNSQKKIVIYAKTNIEPGDEITYDYHFPLEEEKIPCLCGSPKCRGFLN